MAMPLPSQDNVHRLYQPLDRTRSEIRLFSIVASESTDSIVECHMETVSLTQNPHYTALSYVWGDPSITKDIRVNGETRSVTTNLESALSHIRCTLPISEDKANPDHLPTLYWVDAICINQMDLLERGHQVELMKSIYQDAVGVLSWLGPATKGLDMAMTGMRLIGDEWDSLQGEIWHDFEWLRKYPVLWEENDEIPTKNKIWNGVLEFIELKYWSRVWVIQEMVLAKELWFMVGRRITHYKSLLAVPNLLLGIYNQRHTKPSFLPGRIWEFWSVFAQTQGWDFTTAIKYFQDRKTSAPPETSTGVIRDLSVTVRYQATDPRDKIYALSGLSTTNVVPNYLSSVKDLYTRVAAMHVKSSTDLDFLRWAGLGREVPSQFELPSWVPDWQRISQNWADCSFELSHADRGMQSLVLDRSFVEKQSLLQAHGCVCTSVNRIEPALGKGTDDLFQFCCRYSRAQANSRSGIPQLQRLFLTVMMNLNNDTEGGPRGWNPNSLELHEQAITFIKDIIPNGIGHRSKLDQVQRYTLELGLGCGDQFLHFYNEIFPSGFDITELWASAEDAWEADLNVAASTTFTMALKNYRFFHTASGSLGMAPPKTPPGALVCVLDGCSFPVILQKVDSHYVYIGECFILGLMEGEAAKLIENGQAFIQGFEIH